MQRSVDLPSHYAAFRPLEDSKKCGGRHWWEWALLVVSLGNKACLLGLSAVDMTQANKTSTTNQTPVFGPSTGFIIPLIDILDLNFNPAFTFDLAMIFTSIITGAIFMYALFSEKKYELCICPLMITVAVAFCIPEYVVNVTNRTDGKLVRIIICSILSLLSIPLTAKTVSERYWTEFQIAGASDGLMGMYRRLKFFNALLKLDAFALVLLGTFSLTYALASTSTNWCFFGGFLVYAVLSLTVGSFAVNLEMKFLVFAFVVISIFLPLVVPFQLMSFQCILIPQIPCSEMRKLIVSCAIATAILAIILRTYILLVLLQVYRHFGYGLTDAAFAGLIANETTSLLGRRGRNY